MGGLSAAVAGALARVGLGAGGGGSVDGGGSTSGSSTGIVSRRLADVEQGRTVVPVQRQLSRPSFIEVPSDERTTSSVAPSVLACDQSVAPSVAGEVSVEVEGPHRPSSQYAI